MQWWVKPFHKGNERLEDEQYSGSLLEADNDQLKGSLKLSSCNYRETAEELNIILSMVIWQLKKIGKVKKLDKWVPDELTENFFKLSFLDQIVICDEKCILFDNF